MNIQSFISVFLIAQLVSLGHVVYANEGEISS